MSSPAISVNPFRKWGYSAYGSRDTWPITVGQVGRQYQLAGVCITEGGLSEGGAEAPADVTADEDANQSNSIVESSQPTSPAGPPQLADDAAVDRAHVDGRYFVLWLGNTLFFLGGAVYA